MGKVKNTYEWSYKNILRYVLSGEICGNRNESTYTQFATQVTADLSEGFPMLTSRKQFFYNVLHELKWMLNGDTNTKYLKENGVSIWDLWADDNGDLGPIYGHQMRNFAGVDQIKYLLEEMSKEYRSRRGLISMWNPADLPDMKLPPCHHSFNLVDINGKLNLALSMRSSDLYLGLPYNMSFYSLLLILFCQDLDKEPGKVTITSADSHIYVDHKDQVKEYLKAPLHDLPKLVMPKEARVLDFDPNTLSLEGYKHEKHLAAKVHK